MNHRLHVGFFEDEHDVLAAAKECRERQIPIADVVSPYPIHGLDAVLGLRPSRLPWVTLTGALVGAGLGLWFEYWSAWDNWPINVGGKPFDSLPAFVPVAFELTILFAGLATFFLLLDSNQATRISTASPIIPLIYSIGKKMVLCSRKRPF